MKFITTIILFAFVVVYSEAACRDGYWGATCNNACGACAGDNNKCDAVTGKCPNAGKTGACEQGWEGDGCDQPICFGTAGCDNDGKCVAPNYCVCGESGAQVVGVNKMYDGIQGVNCVSKYLTVTWSNMIFTHNLYKDQNRDKFSLTLFLIS